MSTLIVIVHVVVCLMLICIVLLQTGKGADMGAAFGGSSQALFGGAGPAPFLTRVTTIAAVVFMVTSLTLAYFSANVMEGSVMRGVEAGPGQAVELPAVPEGMPGAPVQQQDQPAAQE
jgi:preprotein translocase subunit SecG